MSKTAVERKYATFMLIASHTYEAFEKKIANDE